MTLPRAFGLCLLAFLLGVGVACEKEQTSLFTQDPSTHTDSQKLPFDREPRSEGISPSQSIIPSISRLPEGTPLTIRLQTPLSSASAHSGDRFKGVLDDPIVIDGQTVVARGTSVSGHVLAARASVHPDVPGYLRLALASLSLGGKAFPLETSSVFAKAGSHALRKLPPPSEESDGAFVGGLPSGGKGSLVGAAAGTRETSSSSPDGLKDISFTTEHRLTFRLAQAVDLH